MATHKRKSPRKHRTESYKGFKLRLFVPDDTIAGCKVLELLFVRLALTRILDRKAA